MKSPAPVATAASGVAMASLGLAATGFALRWFELAHPIIALGCVVVALGGSMLGGTLSAIGLMVTRFRRDRRGRRRAWIGAVISVGLLLALVMRLEHEISEPIVVVPSAPIDSRAS